MNIFQDIFSLNFALLMLNNTCKKPGETAISRKKNTAPGFSEHWNFPTLNTF